MWGVPRQLWKSLERREQPLQELWILQGGLIGIIADTGTLGLPYRMPMYIQNVPTGTGNIYQVQSANQVKEWHWQHSDAGVKLGLPMRKIGYQVCTYIIFYIPRSCLDHQVGGNHSEQVLGDYMLYSDPPYYTSVLYIYIYIYKYKYLF